MPLTLEKIKNRDLTIGIVGLGYVGYPLALVFAEAGVKVLGFDVDQNKIDSILDGKSYFKHINGDRLGKLVETNMLSATADFSKSASCDVIIICVPTPLTHHLEPDLHFIEDTCTAIAPHLQPHTLISLESTTWPGTTEEIVKTIIEKQSDLRVGKDLYLCFSPEREDPGNPQYKTRNIPKLVGGIDSTSLNLGEAVYKLALDDIIPVQGTRVAEAAKLFENIFRSVNIALVNEMKVILDKMKVNVWDVIEAASSKPFGFMRFSPGPGLGGHCIPIDPFYLTWKAKEFGIRTRFIELSGEINRSMPKWVISKVQDCLNEHKKPINGSKILVLGLAYKSDVEDIRESPSLELMRLLEEKGATVEYHDPLVSELHETREFPELTGKKSTPLSSEYDCFLLATAHSIFSADEFLSYNVPIIDTRNFLPTNDLVHPA